MQDYQTYIQELEELHGWTSVDLVHNCFLMGEEMGELFKSIRKFNQYFNETSHTPINKDQQVQDIADELVDVFNYLVAIANRLNIDLEEAFRHKNELNQKRSWK